LSILKSDNLSESKKSKLYSSKKLFLEFLLVF